MTPRGVVISLVLIAPPILQPPREDLSTKAVVERAARYVADYQQKLTSVVADEDYTKYFNYFSNDRYFSLPSGLGKVIGKPMLFSLTNSWAKFYQVDKLRGMEAMKKEF